MTANEGGRGISRRDCWTFMDNKEDDNSDKNIGWSNNEASGKSTTGDNESFNDNMSLVKGVSTILISMDR